MSALRSSLSSVVDYGTRLLGRKQKGVRILCYHRVNDSEKNYLTVPVRQFRAQMEFLAWEGYQTIRLNSLLAKETLERSIVITFDDGYRDNYEHAYPILKEFGFSAAIFCITGRMNTGDYLTAQDIRHMRTDGFEFGSHTVSHPRLGRLSSVEKWREILDSKGMLEDLSGGPVDFFCYPYGDYDAEAVDLVKKAGYLGACSNHPGANAKKTSAYLLKRTEISPADTVDEFRKKLSGAFDLLHQGLHWVRGRT